MCLACVSPPVLFFLNQKIDFPQPQACRSVRRHTPVAARREGEARRLGVSRNTVRHLQSLSLEEVLQQKERHYKLHAYEQEPQVNYKEAITKTVNLREVYKKQSGGRGKFADIIVNIGPADADFTLISHVATRPAMMTLKLVASTKAESNPNSLLPLKAEAKK